MFPVLHLLVVGFTTRRDDSGPALFLLMVPEKDEAELKEHFSFVR